MSAFNDPGKLETAMAAVVSALNLVKYIENKESNGTMAVRTGQDDDDVVLPRVVCEVPNGETEVVLDTGVFRSRVNIRVVSSLDVGLANHKTRSATVFDTFISTDIASRLAAAVADFHVYEFRYQPPELPRKEPGAEADSFVFVSELSASVVWCGSDIV